MIDAREYQHQKSRKSAHASRIKVGVWRLHPSIEALLPLVDIFPTDAQRHPVFI